MPNNFAIPPTMTGSGGSGTGSVTPTSAQFSALSNKVSTLSQNLSLLSNTNSAEHVALSARANSINTFISGISALSIGGISTHGLQSVINALSNRISATVGGGGGSVTSTELSAVSAQAASAINVVSNAVSVVSNALSNEISNRASAVSAVSHGLSVLSQQNSVEHAALSLRSNSINTFLSGISALSVGGVSTHGIQSVVNALSNRISAVVAGGGVSVTSSELSAVSAQAASAINIVSIAVVNETSNRVSSHANIANLISGVSQRLSLLSNTNSVQHAALSVRINSIDIFLSGISALSVGGISTHGIQSVINALSNRISATAGGGGGSVTSAELQTVSAQAASAINVVSNALSAETIDRISADNILSNAISAVSNNLSILSQQNSVEHAALSLRINSAGGGGGGSVTSAELQAVSAQANSAINVVSNTASVADVHASIASAAATSADAHANAASAAATSVDARLNSVISVFLSATGMLVPQIRTRENVVSVISAATLADIASLSISVQAGGTYLIDGNVMFECGTSGGFAFGCSVPALAPDGSFVQMNMASSPTNENNANATGNRSFSAVAANQFAIVSASIINAAIRNMNFTARLAVSADGTFQIMARTSVAGASMSVRGGYIRSYRII